MPEQLSLLDYAQRRRERGMGLAADAEDREQPAFADLAYETIVTVARRQATVFVDDVLAECRMKPHHFNVWGSIYMRAIKAGVIVHSGQVRSSSDPSKNAHKSPVYRSLIFGKCHV